MWQIVGSRSMKVNWEVVPLCRVRFGFKTVSDGRLLNHCKLDSLSTHRHLSVVMTSNINSDPFKRKFSRTSGLCVVIKRYCTVVVTKYDLLHVSLANQSVHLFSCCSHSFSQIITRSLRALVYKVLCLMQATKFESRKRSCIQTCFSSFFVKYYFTFLFCKDI